MRRRLRTRRRWFIVFPVGILLALSWTSAADETSLEATIASYARYGADVWARNPTALISGEGRACISCHTSLPYALVEPLLDGDHPAYRDLIANVDNRILTWSDNTPWYSDEKLEGIAGLASLPPDTLKPLLDAEDSRGVEAVFNALIRATHDAYSNRPAQPETRAAFENMWAAQVEGGPAAGRWRWIKANLVPWEVADSDIWGASLACVAAGVFPELAPEGNLRLLHDSLRRSFADDGVSLHTKSAILWCHTESPEPILQDDEASGLAAALLAAQREDGGWALRDLGPWADWEGSDADCCQKREPRSDAYATGFVTLVLARSRGHWRGQAEDSLEKAITWIDRELANPYPDGPRYNKHNSADSELPEFRNNLYTNGGHMWAYLARAAHLERRAPWAAE